MDPVTRVEILDETDLFSTDAFEKSTDPAFLLPYTK